MLAGAWYLDRKGEVAPGELPCFDMPILHYHQVSSQDGGDGEWGHRAVLGKAGPCNCMPPPVSVATCQQGRSPHNLASAPNLIPNHFGTRRSRPRPALQGRMLASLHDSYYQVGQLNRSGF